jgi:hypothetical protein
MADIAVERLVLRISGISAEHATALGRRVAEGLGDAALGVDGPARAARLRLSLDAGTEPELDRLAERVVDRIVGELERMV